MPQSKVLAIAIAGIIATALSGGIEGQESKAPESGLRPLLAPNTNLGALREVDALVQRGLIDGTLRLRSSSVDPLVPERETERFDQFYSGVPVWGADLVRDTEHGITVSSFGAVAQITGLNIKPSLDAEAAVALALSASGDPTAHTIGEVRLVILPSETAGLHLAYTAVVAGEASVERVFVDAQTGAELLRYNELQGQAAATGVGTGVLGDRKKLSVQTSSGTYIAFDRLRPPIIQTFDFRNNLPRAKAMIAGTIPFTTADTASDSDNQWTDPAVVDAHAHVSWTYDYYYLRFGRSGLDGRDAPIYIGVNGLSQQGALTAAASDGQYITNAFWCGGCAPAGVMFFGSGIPSGYYFASSGRNYTYFSGALDIAAHELTHAVTSNSSRLVYLNESGALNEAFSDMMGKSVEFFYHPAGSTPGRADYVIGKDISRAVVPGALNGDRSLADPRLYGDPDHYSRRYVGAGDNGGVHTNSGIANNAFYLAIEGGSNRTSGLSVQGVGAARREQIEKVFYRAFVQLMPSSGNFATARAVTAQAARDLYGSGGPVEVAVTQAWSAVGVF